MSEFTEEKIEIDSNSDYKWYILQTFNSLTAKNKLSQDDIKKGNKLRISFDKANKGYLLQEVFLAIEEKRNIYTNEIQYHNLAPGYIFVKMLLNQETKEILTSLQKTVGLIMGGYNKPHIVSEKEIDHMKNTIQEKNNKQDKFEVGDVVKILNKDFSEFKGVITEIIDDTFAKVTINIFSRNTIIELSIKELEKINDIYDF